MVCAHDRTAHAADDDAGGGDDPAREKASATLDERLLSVVGRYP